MGGNGPDERRGGDERPDPDADARAASAETARAGTAQAGTVQAGTVSDAVEELYSAAPEAFTERRQALAAAAREAGDKRAASAITALRKPTRAAWVVNRLARTTPDAPARLAALAAALRGAEQDKDGPRLRELSAERGALIDALTAQALASASVPDPPTSLRDEVSATLTAALADPETAAEFAAGTLTKAAHWSGFGLADLGSAGFGAADFAATGRTSTDAPVPLVDGSDPGITEASAAGRVEPDAAAKKAPSSKARPSAPAPSTRPARSPRPPRRVDTAGSEQGAPPPRAGRRADGPPDEVAARRAAQRQRAAEEERRAAEERHAAELQEQLAREAADRAAERRKNYQDMERTVASAASATAEAESAEERLEAEVRDLEERLIQAKADLAKARLRARHAESAERRARQSLDRLPRP